MLLATEVSGSCGVAGVSMTLHGGMIAEFAGRLFLSVDIIPGT
jgi:hypothetical protein